jgi:hypothetical protein
MPPLSGAGKYCYSNIRPRTWRRATLCSILLSHSGLESWNFDFTLTSSDTRETHDILIRAQSCVFWRSKAVANSAWSRLLPIILFPTQYFLTLGRMVKRSAIKIWSMALGKVRLATKRSSFVGNKRLKMASNTSGWTLVALISRILPSLQRLLTLCSYVLVDDEADYDLLSIEEIPGPHLGKEI